MRVCQCILGRNGKCCQDGAPWEQGRSWISTSGSGGQTYAYGQPRRVRKMALFGGKGWWTVTNHPAGTQSFRTWREAMHYATSPYLLMNAVN